MAKRKGSGALDDLYRIAAALPWWVGAVAAMAVYLYLHHLALQPMPEVKDLHKELSSVLWHQGIRVFALYGQYVLPFFLLAGAITSFIQRHKRRRLLSQVQTSSSVTPLAELSWHQFELMVGEYFRQLGYRVQETPAGPDGGVDLRVVDGADIYLVQCKLWKAHKVPVNVVRELYGVMMAEGAAGAIVVAAGEFTVEAKAFAEGRNISLVDGRSLLRSVKQKQGTIQAAGLNAVTPQSSIQPICPLCGSAMVQRKARRGVNAGALFFGCSRYPACKGVLNH